MTAAVKIRYPRAAMQSTQAALAAFTEGLKVWPGVRLSQERFCALVQESGVTTPDLSKRASDIFLAIACLERDERALRHFDKTILAISISTWAAMRCSRPLSTTSGRKFASSYWWGLRRRSAVTAVPDHWPPG